MTSRFVSSLQAGMVPHVLFWLGLCQLVVRGGTFQLTSSVTEIHSGSAMPVDLKCFHTGSWVHIVKVTGLRIRKQDSVNGRFVTVASLADRIETSPNVKAEGKIGDSLEDTFLTAVVDGSAKEKAGVYFCDFFGTDANNHGHKRTTNMVAVTLVEDSDEVRLAKIRNRVKLLRKELNLYKRHVESTLQTLTAAVQETVQALHATATDCVITEDEMKKWQDTFQGDLIDEALIKTGHLIQNRFEESQCEENSLGNGSVVPVGSDEESVTTLSKKEDDKDITSDRKNLTTVSGDRCVTTDDDDIRRVTADNDVRRVTADDDVRRVTTDDDDVRRVTTDDDNVRLVTTDDDDVRRVTTDDDNVRLVTTDDDDVRRVTTDDIMEPATNDYVGERVTTDASERRVTSTTVSMKEKADTPLGRKGNVDTTLGRKGKVDTPLDSKEKVDTPLVKEKGGRHEDIKPSMTLHIQDIHREKVKQEKSFHVTWTIAVPKAIKIDHFDCYLQAVLQVFKVFFSLLVDKTEFKSNERSAKYKIKMKYKFETHELTCKAISSSGKVVVEARSGRIY